MVLLQMSVNRKSCKSGMYHHHCNNNVDFWALGLFAAQGSKFEAQALLFVPDMKRRVQITTTGPQIYN